MEKINKLSKNKHYDVVFLDINDNCCGTVEDITGISNKYEINNYAYDVCTKVPRHAIVTNTDGSETGRWTLSLDWFNREY
jgi:hypothetical protein